MMQTGRLFTGGVDTPHLGSVVGYLRGRRSDLPPFVILPETMGRGGGGLPNGQAGGFLGKGHDPFALMADPSKPDFKGPSFAPAPIAADRRRNRRQFRSDRKRPFARQQLSNCLAADDKHSGAGRL